MKSTKTQYIFISFLLFKLSNQETCHYENVEGTIDLTPLNSMQAFQTFISPPTNVNDTVFTTYYFHPCTDAKQIPGDSKNDNTCSERGFSVSLPMNL